MVKSSLRKARSTTVKTNKVISWADNVTIVSTVVETGSTIYIIPRKGEAFFDRMLWSYFLNEDPVADTEIQFGILDHGPEDSSVEMTALEMANASLITAVQNWQVVTAVGIVQTVTTLEAEMDATISRRSDLNHDNEYSIVPVYRGNQGVNVAQRGTLFVKETLFQESFVDDQSEWNGYTWEESAA